MVRSYVHHRHSQKQEKKNTKKIQHSKPTPVLLVLVFANWCGHCEMLKPEWSKMKEELLMHPGFKHGKILEIEDSDPEKDAKLKELGDNITINGYPTIFKKPYNGPVEYYGGERNKDEMMAWAIGGKHIGGRCQRGGYNSGKTAEKTAAMKKSTSRRRTNKKTRSKTASKSTRKSLSK
jgi:thiol-disulfide isomerase/thioredoxin